MTVLPLYSGVTPGAGPVPEQSPYGDSVDPDKAPEAISNYPNLFSFNNHYKNTKYICMNSQAQADKFKHRNNISM